MKSVTPNWNKFIWSKCAIRTRRNEKSRRASARPPDAATSNGWLFCATANRIIHMNRIVHIAYKEWLGMMRDRRFQVAGSVVVVLLICALVMGVTRQKELRAERQAATRESRAAWLGQSSKDPHNATHEGFYVVKPVAAASAFDPGVESYTGTVLLLESHKQEAASLQAGRDEGVSGRFGTLSIAAMLQLLVPLLIIIVGFETFAAERESGTLRLVMAQGVSRTQLLGGKLLGVGVALLLLLVPAAAICAFVLLAGAPSGGGSLPLERYALTAGFYTLYFATFVCLTFAVSAWAKTARVALVGLLGYWIFASLFAPRLTSDLARTLHPTPSNAKFASWLTEAKDKENSVETPRERVKNVQTRLMRQYGVTRLADLPVNYRGVMLQEAEARTNRAFDGVNARLWSAFDGQNDVYTAASVAAPLLAMRELSMGLSETDWAAHQHFARQVETYRRDWVALMNADLTKHPPSKGEYKADITLWQQVPVFEYQAPTTRQILTQQRVGIAVLVGWFCLSLALLFGAVIRMKVV